MPRDESEYEIQLCPESGQTDLTAPIKIRWSGYLRERITERHGEYMQSDDNPSNDEGTRSVYRSLSREKTNIVLKTVEEAEYFIETLSWYAGGGITWMNGPMRSAARRVKSEVRQELNEGIDEGDNR